MANFDHCPNCHARAKSGALTGGSFRIFECKKCRELYCYLCHGTNGGKRCPSCGSSDYSVAGTCYPK
jgi:hypothetical protein